MAVPSQETFMLRNSAGRKISLSGPAVYVIEHDGLGEPETREAIEQGPYQDGQTLTGEQLERRVITLKLLISADEELLEAHTDEFHKMFNQLGRSYWLDVTRKDGEVRRLDVRRKAGLSLPRKAGDPYGQLIDVIQLVADDPIAYNTDIQLVVFALGGGGTGTPVPTLIPMSVGASAIDMTLPITYAGTWRAFPIIRFYGPLTDPILTNVTTGEKLSFSGVTIADGDWYEVDCRYGYKTVVDDGGNNKLADLATDSDLATFHIAPEDEAVGGINEFHLTATSVNMNSKVNVQYQNRYLGVL